MRENFRRIAFAVMRTVLPSASLIALLTVPALAQSPVIELPSASQAHDLDLGGMDVSVNPGDDFYRYANGKWLDSTSIPAQYSSWGTFRILRDNNLAVLHTIAEHALTDTSASPNSTEGKVGSFYRSGMDEARIEAAGLTPLAPQMADINAVHDVPSLITEIGRLRRSGIGSVFSFWVDQDQRDSSQEIPSLGQGGLSLPAPSYYTDPGQQAVRDAYVAHLATMFALLGETSAQAAADSKAVMAIETALAAASKAPADLREPVANYHKMTLAGLDSLTPDVNWQPFFESIDLPKPGAMNIAQPAFFTALNHDFTSIPLADWKSYLRASLVDSESPLLSNAFVTENFHFYGTILQGIPENQPRWKRVLSVMDRQIGQALGQLYVAQTFPPAAKARALTMVENLKSVLRGDLATVPWMSEATRQQAIVKLDAMGIKIGYPDKWRDYSRLDVTSPDYVVNVIRADQFEFQRELHKLGKPVDRQEWDMTPQTVNAYYDPAMNQINFPAGILQPPFFDPKADDAINYGAIGWVIGHEMTHGFDDQGRKYDSRGNLRDWWTATDTTNFKARAEGIVAQYGGYDPLPGLHINGSLTQGENIADIGGLKVAYLALEKDLAGKPRPLIDGFTPEQRFFIAFAQICRSKERPQSLRVSVNSDPHSPMQYRVIGALADTPEFRQAFNLPVDPAAHPTTVW